MIRFTALGMPQTAGSKRAFYNPKLGRAMVIDDNPKARDWKETVASAARQVYQGPLIEGPLQVWLTFLLPRPAGHFGKKGLRASAPPFPAKRPDVLKLARCVEDALTGVVWRDDAQIVVEIMCKTYAEPASVQVVIEQLESTSELTPAGVNDARIPEPAS